MKKNTHLRIVYFILLFSVCQISFAQTEVNTSFAARMNYIFANLDKSKVPYGILRDYGMEFINLENYNGLAVLADTNAANASTLWNVYNGVGMSRISG